jgi:hypothetical protein
LAVLALFSGGVGGNENSRFQDPVPTQLGDVIITALPSIETAETFVQSVAGPIGDRDMALWREPICVGVGNLQAEVAQAIADRVSDWADALGLVVDEPGCRPNIFVTATENGNTTARELVAARRQEFVTGVGGSDRGRTALDRFQRSDRLVRWWHVSLAVDERTGNPIRRMPGQPPVDWTGRRLSRVTDFGVNAMITSPSRLTRSGRDDFQQVMVILDIDAFEAASLGQIADYIAMVALAQIDPEAQPTHPSILSLFDESADQAEMLTRWDQAFLHGLYSADQNRADPNANRSTVAHAMAARLRSDATADR